MNIEVDQSDNSPTHKKSPSMCFSVKNLSEVPANYGARRTTVAKIKQTMDKKLDSMACKTIKVPTKKLARYSVRQPPLGKKSPEKDRQGSLKFSEQMLTQFNMQNYHRSRMDAVKE